MQRREALSSMVAIAAGTVIPKTNAEEVTLGQPWSSGQASLPVVPNVAPDALTFFTAEEFKVVNAISECFIPADELSVSGKDAGCATFIDRQLSGDYGNGVTMYRLGRFVKGTPEQGTQSSLTPAQRWRKGIAAMNAYSQTHFQKSFVDLSAEQQNSLLALMETGKVDLGSDVEVQPLFEQMLQNVREGFLADPIYGGNKDMVAWKMIGFPGAQYDFRDVLDKKGVDLKIIPISLVDNTL